ncbi:hypothetical protein WAI453_008797 [Rhynchosporium graminicola]
MSAMDMFWAAPPISRTLAASAFFLSVCCHTGMLSFGYVLFTFAQLMKFPPYIWTPITSFLITGAQIGIVIDTYFLYTYSSQLEMGNPRLSGTGDYFMYLVFVCSVILVGYTLITCACLLAVDNCLTPSLSTFLPYVAHRIHLLICPCGAMLPATTVPENEEDYPYTSASPSFAKYIRASSRCGHGGKFL